MPRRRLIDVAEIDPNTFYHRLDFRHRQCPLFAANRERSLVNLALPRLSLRVDRQDYLVNWFARDDQRNVRLSAMATGDNKRSYGFGIHLNFDPSLDKDALQAEFDKNGGLNKPYPHRRFARLWLNTD